MEILENSKLKLDEKWLRLWPFWSYGYTGTDGADWRQHYTDQGVKSIPDIAEEARPLDLETALSLGLGAAMGGPEHFRNGVTRSKVRVHVPLTAAQLLQEILSRYAQAPDGPEVYIDRHGPFGRGAGAIPEPFQSLAASGAEVTFGPDGLDGIDIKLL